MCDSGKTIIILAIQKVLNPDTVTRILNNSNVFLFPSTTSVKNVGKVSYFSLSLPLIQC